MKPTTKKQTPLEAAAARLIADYTGDRVSRVQVFEDPMVRGTYAIRAQVAGPGTIGEGYLDALVITGGRGLAAMTADDVEEVEFEHWPPRSTGQPTGWSVSW